MSCRNLLGLPDRRHTFPGRLETDLVFTCAAPRSGGWFGEQFPITCYEPNNLIEISSEHTPINFPSKRNSFRTDFNDEPTIIAASDATDTLDAGVTVCLCPSANSSKRQQRPTTASITECRKPLANVNCWELRETGVGDTHVVESFGKLQRSDCSDVETSMLKEKRDREFGKVSSQEQEKLLSERQNSPRLP